MYKLKYPQNYKKQRKSRKHHHTYTPTDSSLIKTRQPSQTQKTYYVYVANPYILPTRFVSFLRRLLKKRIKKRSIRCWLVLKPNVFISNKPKNSRMGKGVGTINRKGFKLKPTTPWLALANISNARVQILRKFLESRLGVKLEIRNTLSRLRK